MWDQYVSYLGQVARLDFGVSYTFYPQSVSSMVSTALPYTIGLVGIVTVLAFVIGTLIGVAAAWRRGTWLDSLPTLTGSFLSTFPYFWTALLLLFFFGYVLHWFPTTGAYAATTAPGFTGDFLADLAQHAVLPALTILLTSLGGWIIGMRNAMINTLGEDYVTFAQANGVPERRIALRYSATASLSRPSKARIAPRLLNAGAAGFNSRARRQAFSASPNRAMTV
jgi:peptide/nickel transport system permease protein